MGLMSAGARSLFVVVVVVAVAGGAPAQAARVTSVLVTPAHGALPPAELEQATMALQAHLTSRATQHGLRPMARETYQKMIDEKRIAGGCVDLACDVKEATTLLVDLVVSSRFTADDGTTQASVKLVDPRSGVVKASAKLEALTLPALLTALTPALDKALGEAFPPAAEASERRSDARSTPILPGVNFNFGVGVGRGGGGSSSGRGNNVDVGPGRQKDCSSNLDCKGAGAWCRERGNNDGRKVCMDDGAAGDFCQSGNDCAGTMFCKERGDGYKVCM